MAGGGIIPITARITGRDSLSPTLSKINKQFRFMASSLRFADAAAAELTSKFSTLANRAGDALFSISSKSIKASTSLEFKMKRIGAISNISSNGIESLKDEFMDLVKVVPMSADSLAGVGITAARMGIDAPKAIAALTKEAAKLAVVAEDLNETQAVEGLGKAIMVMNSGLDPKNIDQYTKVLHQMTSALVGTAAASKTSEGQLIQFITRMGASATTIGLNTAEVLAFSAAAADLGKAPERSTRAFSKLFDRLIMKSDELSMVFGMTKEQYLELFQTEGGGAKILQNFFKLLGALKDYSPELSNIFLKEMGLGANASFKELYYGLAKAPKLIEKHLNNSRDAYKNSNIQSEVFNQLMETGEQKLAGFWAALDNVNIAISYGLLDSFKVFIDMGKDVLIGFLSLNKEFHKFVGTSIAVGAAIFKTVGAVGALLSSMASLRFVFFLLLRTFYPDLISVNQKLGGLIFSVIRTEFRYFALLARGSATAIFSISLWYNALLTLASVSLSLVSIFVSLGIAAATIFAVGIPAFIAFQKLSGPILASMTIAWRFFISLVKATYQSFSELSSGAKSFIKPISDYFDGVILTLEKFNGKIMKSTSIINNIFSQDMPIADKWRLVWNRLSRDNAPLKAMGEIFKGIIAFLENSTFKRDLYYYITDSIISLYDIGKELVGSLTYIFKPITSLFDNMSFAIDSSMVENFLTSIYNQTRKLSKLISESFNVLWTSMHGVEHLTELKSFLRTVVEEIVKFGQSLGTGDFNLESFFSGNIIPVFKKIGENLNWIITLFKEGSKQFAAFLNPAFVKEGQKNLDFFDKFVRLFVFFIPFVGILEASLFSLFKVMSLFGLNLSFLLPKAILVGSFALFISLLQELGYTLKDIPLFLHQAFVIGRDAILAFFDAVNLKDKIKGFVDFIKNIVSSFINVEGETRSAFDRIRENVVSFFASAGKVVGKLITYFKVGLATMASFFGFFPELYKDIQKFSLLEKIAGSFLVFLPVLAMVIRSFALLARTMGFSGSVIYWFTYSARGLFIAMSSSLFALFAIITFIVPALESFGISLSLFSKQTEGTGDNLSKTEKVLRSFFDVVTAVSHAFWDGFGASDFLETIKYNLKNLVDFYKNFFMGILALGGKDPFKTLAVYAEIFGKKIRTVVDAVNDGFLQIREFFGVFGQTKFQPGFINELKIFSAVLPTLLVAGAVFGIFKKMPFIFSLFSVKLLLLATGITFFIEKMNALGISVPQMITKVYDSFKGFFEGQEDGSKVLEKVSGIWNEYVRLARVGTDLLFRFFNLFQDVLSKSGNVVASPLAKFLGLLVTLPPVLAVVFTLLKKLNWVLSLAGLSFAKLSKGFLIGAPIALLIVILDELGVTFKDIDTFLVGIIKKLNSFVSIFVSDFKIPETSFLFLIPLLFSSAIAKMGMFFLNYRKNIIAAQSLSASAATAQNAMFLKQAALQAKANKLGVVLPNVMAGANTATAVTATATSMTATQTAAVSATSAIGLFIGKIWTLLKLVGKFSLIGIAIYAVAKAISSIGENSDQIGGNFSTFSKTIFNVIKDTASVVIKVIAGTFYAILSFGKKFFETFESQIVWVFKQIKNISKSTASSLEDFFTATASVMKSTSAKMSDFMEYYGNVSLSQMFIDAKNSFFNYMKSLVSGTNATIGSIALFSAIISTIILSMSKLIFITAAWLAQLNLTLSLPSIIALFNSLYLKILSILPAGGLLARIFSKLFIIAKLGALFKLSSIYINNFGTELGLLLTAFTAFLLFAKLTTIQFFFSKLGVLINFIGIKFFVLSAAIGSIMYVLDRFGSGAALSLLALYLVIVSKLFVLNKAALTISSFGMALKLLFNGRFTRLIAANSNIWANSMKLLAGKIMFFAAAIGIGLYIMQRFGEGFGVLFIGLSAYLIFFTKNMQTLGNSLVLFYRFLLPLVGMFLLWEKATEIFGSTFANVMAVVLGSLYIGYIIKVYALLLALKKLLLSYTIIKTIIKKLIPIFLFMKANLLNMAFAASGFFAAVAVGLYIFDLFKDSMGSFNAALFSILVGLTIFSATLLPLLGTAFLPVVGVFAFLATGIGIFLSLLNVMGPVPAMILAIAGASGVLLAVLAPLLGTAVFSIFGIVAAISAVALLLYGLFTNPKAVGSFFKTVLVWIWKVVSTLASALWTAFKYVSRKLLETLLQFPVYVLGAFFYGLQWLASWFTDSDIFGHLFDKMVSFANYIPMLLDEIASGSFKILDDASYGLQVVWDWIYSSVVYLLDSIPLIMEDALYEVKVLWSWIVDGVNYFKNIGVFLIDGLVGVKNWVATEIPLLATQFKDAFLEVITWLMDKIVALANATGIPDVLRALGVLKEKKEIGTVTKQYADPSLFSSPGKPGSKSNKFTDFEDNFRRNSIGNIKNEEVIKKVTPVNPVVNPLLQAVVPMKSAADFVEKSDSPPPAPPPGGFYDAEPTIKMRDATPSFTALDIVKYLATKATEIMSPKKEEEKKESRQKQEIIFGDITIPVNIDIDGYTIAQQMIKIKGEELKVRFGKPDFRNRGAASLGSGY